MLQRGPFDGPGTGPKGFPCYACDVCLTLSCPLNPQLAGRLQTTTALCPGCGSDSGRLFCPSYRLQIPSTSPSPSPSPCPFPSTFNSRGCTRMVSFTFYVRMLLFFELWRQEQCHSRCGSRSRSCSFSLRFGLAPCCRAASFLKPCLNSPGLYSTRS